jgi:hypothetical protein
MMTMLQGASHEDQERCEVFARGVVDLGMKVRCFEGLSSCGTESVDERTLEDEKMAEVGNFSLEKIWTSVTPQSSNGDACRPCWARVLVGLGVGRRSLERGTC